MDAVIIKMFLFPRSPYSVHDSSPVFNGSVLFRQRWYSILVPATAGSVITIVSTLQEDTAVPVERVTLWMKMAVHAQVTCVVKFVMDTYVRKLVDES